MSQLVYVFESIVQEFNSISFLDSGGCIDLCANDFLRPYNRLSRFPQIDGKATGPIALNHIHRIIEWARDMRIKQIVSVGKYQDRKHNEKKGSATFGDPKVGDIIMIGSDVKNNYCKYGLVVKVFNNTSALVRRNGRLFKYASYLLEPVLREVEGQFKN